MYVLSPFPDAKRLSVFGPALRKVKRSRTRLRWLHPAELPGLEPAADSGGQIARTAARLRAETERRHAELVLRRLGVEAAVCGPIEAVSGTENAALGPKGHRAA